MIPWNLQDTKIMPGFEVIGREESDAVMEVFKNGGVLCRHGFDEKRNGRYYVNEFEEQFAEYHGTQYALAVTSGTAAIRVALAALGIVRSDEVITQAFTFVATVEAIVEAGAIPVCVDIDQTLSIDIKEVMKLITPRTKAIIAVHMLGTPAELRELTDICSRRGIYLIEDTAWGLGASLNDKPLGSWGSIGTFSFDSAKTITTGEGGMLIFKEKEVYNRAKAWHDHGHESIPGVPRWMDSRRSSGFNYRMTELQAAIGIVQLKKLDRIVKIQREKSKVLAEVVARYGHVTVRPCPTGSYTSEDAFVMIFEDSRTCLECKKHLSSEGVGTKILPEALTWHFAGHWDHIPELLERHGGSLDVFHQTRDLLERSLALPLSINMPKSFAATLDMALQNSVSGHV